MADDPWHYPRKELAEQVFGMFESGLSSALVFFAPRRMGKTEFLCRDIGPLAEKRKWRVFYFSFLDVGKNAAQEFTNSLINYAKSKGAIKKEGLLQRVSKLGGEAGGIAANIELRDPTITQKNMKEIIENICKRGKLLLLMDEVQSLTQDPANANFIASLRTILDINKGNVKVIFTGSSQEGLRRMFSQAKAPFFHFGQNLPFPELERGFTDHLAHMFNIVTRRKLDQEGLWAMFLSMQRVPQLARALVERMALNPNLSLEESKNQLMSQIFDDRAFVEVWDQLSALERLLLNEISRGESTPFSAESREKFAKQLGVVELPVSGVQSALRVLQRKGLIGRFSDQRGYFIDDLNFKNWLISSKQ